MTAAIYLAYRIRLHRDKKDPTKDSLTIDMPHYVAAGLEALGLLYIPPTYGATLSNSNR